MTDESPAYPNPQSETAADKLRQAKLERSGGDDEVESSLWEGAYSGKAMTGHWVGLATLTVVLLMVWLAVGALRGSGLAWLILVVVLVGLWAGSWLLMMYRKLSYKYELTTQRFKHRAGILTRVSDRIEVIDIDDVTYKQGPIEALLNVGTITISSSDSTHPHLVLRGIDRVKEIADQIDNVRRAERRKRGLHIEAI